MKVFKLEYDGTKVVLRQFKPPLTREDYIRSFGLEDRQRVGMNYENWVKQYYEKRNNTY